MAKKKRKYYSGKELLYRRQLERQQAEAEEKTNNIRGAPATPDKRKQPGYWLGETENEGGKEQ